MKTIRSGTGPFLERPYFKDSEIERMCAEELRKVGLYPSKPEPVRIDRFVEKRFGISHSYDDLPDGVLGYSKFGPSGVTDIIVTTALDGPECSSTERRLRSTLAHECGHCLMHAYLFALGTKPASLFGEADERPQILCRDIPGEAKSTRGYDGRWWELQANKAIGGLLMPRPLVTKALQAFTVPVGLLGGLTVPSDKREAAIRDLADIFNVNPAVARIRLADVFPIENSGQISL